MDGDRARNLKPNKWGHFRATLMLSYCVTWSNMAATMKPSNRQAGPIIQGQKRFLPIMWAFAPIAQLDRVPGYGADALFSHPQFNPTKTGTTCQALNLGATLGPRVCVACEQIKTKIHCCNNALQQINPKGKPMLINKKAVKELAKEYGGQSGRTLVARSFIEQINRAIAPAIVEAVKKRCQHHDNKCGTRKTLV